MAKLLAPGLVAGEVVSILFGWLVLRLVAGKDWARKVALRRPGPAHLGLALLLFPALVYVGSGMGELAKRLVPSLIDLEETIKLLGYLPWWLAVLCIGFGPGIGEELWCRGFLGRGLVGHYGPVAGMVLTSVLFGLMHIEPRQVVYAPVMGLILHFVYWTTRSLWVPMLLHTLNNSLGILAASKDFPAIPLVKELDAAADQHPALVYGGAVVLLLAVCYALYQSRARLVAADGTGPPPWRPAYPGVEYAPPDSGTRVAHPPPSWVAVAAALAGFAVFVTTCYLALVRG
jgi:membrane protease YdiL (CAAX protease family)